MTSVFDALSHPIRREVLQLLKSGSMNAGDLARHFHVSKPTMSGHFAKLKAAGLVLSENRGGQVIYSLNMSTLEEALHGFMGRMGMLSDVAETDAPKEELQ